jgi:hypothetical protein
MRAAASDPNHDDDTSIFGTLYFNDTVYGFEYPMDDRHKQLAKSRHQFLVFASLFKIPRPNRNNCIGIFVACYTTSMDA